MPQDYGNTLIHTPQHIPQINGYSLYCNHRNKCTVGNSCSTHLSLFLCGGYEMPNPRQRTSVIFGFPGLSMNPNWREEHLGEPGPGI